MAKRIVTKKEGMGSTEKTCRPDSGHIAPRPNMFDIMQRRIGEKINCGYNMCTVKLYNRDGYLFPLFENIPKEHKSKNKA